MVQTTKQRCSQTNERCAEKIENTLPQSILSPKCRGRSTGITRHPTIEGGKSQIVGNHNLDTALPTIVPTRNFLVPGPSGIVPEPSPR